jgi:hypothetical protein
LILGSITLLFLHLVLETAVQKGITRQLNWRNTSTVQKLTCN